MKEIINIENISALHKILGYETPEHPLISVTYAADQPDSITVPEGKYRLNLYMISLKINCDADVKYGRNSLDFQEGTLTFTAPGQVFDFRESLVNNQKDEEGWMLIFHPDFLRHYSLGGSIGGYSFFDYESYEALHVSDKEKKMLLEFVKNIKLEITQNMDKHSQQLIAINIESLLSYSLRYYDRQFYTRSNLNQGVLAQFEHFLKAYFASDQIINNGLPNVQACGEALNLSGYYLSDLLKIETGKTAKEHIHLYMVNQAKNKLLGSTESVSQIAYGFGFEYPQHFSKLFKAKTGMSPSEYRNLN